MLITNLLPLLARYSLGFDLVAVHGLPSPWILGSVCHLTAAATSHGASAAVVERRGIKR